nr:MAG: endonuclease [Vulcanisaeta sp. AZ3]
MSGGCGFLNIYIITITNMGSEERVLEVVREGDDEYSLVKPGPNYVKSLEERGIGERRGALYVLRTIELIYLLMSEYRVVIDGREVNVNELVKHINNPYALTVYLDMRKRGYFIRPVANGPVDFLVWDKGKSPIDSSPRYMIKIVTEGLEIQIMKLLNVLKYSESMGAQLVLALVSSEGVITYYKAFTFKPVRGD